MSSSSMFSYKYSFIILYYNYNIKETNYNINCVLCTITVCAAKAERGSTPSIADKRGSLINVCETAELFFPTVLKPRTSSF